MSEHASTAERYPSFIGSDRPLARAVARPIQGFIHLEVSGGIILLVATAAALIWANVSGHSYHDFWFSEVNIHVGSWHFEEHLELLVNDALMAVFFFVVGLEIKRELVVGELRDPRAAAVPAIAALGGMIVPAVIYVAFNAGTNGSGGWGIPMATDIAFALGVVALLGSRVPATLKIFLLTLAIVDDIGAIVVIAIFYTDDLAFGWLGAAAAGLVVVAVMRRLHVWYVPAYCAVGACVWYAMFESGVHATIAGVALGLMAPARPLMDRDEAEAVADELEYRSLTAQEVRLQAFKLKESVSICERLEAALHPWTSYVIIPIFALANAGIILSGDTISSATTARVTLGVVFGLVVGKPVGVLLACWVATRFGLHLPRGASWMQMAAIGCAAGIGFTVSIFITGLAFDEAILTDEAKIGILFASLVAAVGSMIFLWKVTTAPRPTSEDAQFAEAATAYGEEGPSGPNGGDGAGVHSPAALTTD